LFNVTFPELLTVPEYVIKPPVIAGAIGQVRLTAIAGLMETVQVVEAVLVTTIAVQISLPVALKVVVTKQVSAATLYEAVKFVDAPGASVDIVKTTLLEAGRSLTRTTLVKVMLPMFCTVPL
jgi:hypothetical protein